MCLKTLAYHLGLFHSKMSVLNVCLLPYAVVLGRAGGAVIADLSCLTLQALMMAVARDAAQDAVRTSERPYSNFPMPDYSVALDNESVTEEECPTACELGTEQAAAMPGKGSGTETSPAMDNLDHNRDNR